MRLITARARHGGTRRLVIVGLAVAIAAAVGGGLLAIAQDKDKDPTGGATRMKYVDAAEQLIVELYVRDWKRSTAFYEQLGFKESTDLLVQSRPRWRERTRFLGMSDRIQAVHSISAGFAECLGLSHARWQPFS